jgi:hypothetical protein
MSDVSVPPTHPDDEVVTRKILREELAKELANHPTNQRFDALEERFDKFEERFDKFEERFDKSERRVEERFDEFERSVAARFTAMQQHIIDQMTVLLEPSRDHGPRITRLEARTEILTERTVVLEARRTVRRPPTKKRATRKPTTKK